MTYRHIEVEPLTPTIGAEIRGVDLGEPLPEAVFEEIHHAFLEHCVIFFRDQDITPEQQVAFARRFGPLHVHPTAPSLGDDPAVMKIHTDRDSRRNNGGGWHSDVSCDEEPPLGTVLRIHTLPPCGGDTLFASMYAAWESLSEPMREMLEPLTALHESEHVYRGLYGEEGTLRRNDYPRAEHPVARTHPETGRKALFVNRGFTTRILGLEPEESEAVLGYLLEHATQPLFQCRFRWRPNSIAFWDNRCVQHLALWDYWPHTRSGVRVTIAGDRPRH